jgi:membrane protein DedA with SNARE-associated domain
MNLVGHLHGVIVIAGVSGQLTHWIAQHGAYAVFGLMAGDALLPVGGELIMLYAGVLAGGMVSGEQASLFGMTLAPGAESYVVLALAGSLGYPVGALVGWALGAAGGRGLIERHGRLLHVRPDAFERAQRWFARHGSRAVFLGRITPVVRSLISVPAGVLGSPLPSYTLLTLLGSMLWCFAFAGASWALGGAWESFHHSVRYADYAVVAALLGLLAFILIRRPRGASAVA